MRLDYPWPIRCQDIVELNADQSFKLIGRIPQSTLKGCSLLVDEVKPSKKENKNEIHNSLLTISHEEKPHP